MITGFARHLIEKARNSQGFGRTLLSIKLTRHAQISTKPNGLISVLVQSRTVVITFCSLKDTIDSQNPKPDGRITRNAHFVKLIAYELCANTFIR